MVAKTKTAKRVSVVVVNWDRCGMLRECLASLVRQEGVDFDVVLVDNGSSDASVPMARREFEASRLLDLRIICNDSNRGYCAGNNQGIAASNSEFVALLNNDAEADPGWLRAMVDAMAAAPPEVGMAASKILWHSDPQRLDKVGHLIYLDGQNRGRGSGEIDRGQYDGATDALWPDGCAALYRRTMLDEIGGFDEDFFAYADDAELGLRARIAGWGCVYVPAAVVRHHRGTTLGLQSSRRLELIERNRVLLAVRHFPWSLLCLNPIFYGARLASGAWAAARGKGEIGKFAGPENKAKAALAMIRGDLQAIPRIPGTLAKRYRMRRLRRLSGRQIRRLIFDHRITLRELNEQSL